MDFIAAAFLALYMCFTPINFQTVIQIETPSIVIQDLQSDLYKDTIQVIEKEQCLVNKSPSLSDSDKEITLKYLNNFERELKKAQIFRHILDKNTEVVQVFDSKDLKISIKHSTNHTNDNQSIFDKMLSLVSQS
ncbi:hypothetical protein FD723_39755 (plasmid) [Nostoc sp. C052]|uniref:hypothetical protein n=1 Tax=Nostoc sp. C052 TaxID=2576902 RepID=UPI0015C3EE61|nr:hypothetical protein [Nostoc sp. C052]QLE46348.1 hypothetical protein FD723_39755 [Nostoc sp. C052]